MHAGTQLCFAVHVFLRTVCWQHAYLLLCGAAGSDLLGETVAALAAIAIVFDSIDANYSNTLEAHARDLYV